MLPCGVTYPAATLVPMRVAEDRVRLHGHGAGERRHLAVVHDLEGHPAPPLLQRAEDAADVAVEVGLGDSAVERAHPGLVVDVDAGRAAPDRVDAREVGRRPPERVVDALEVVPGVLLEVGVPDHLVREHHLAVDHGGALAVGAAEVEADPAAVEVASEGLRRLAHGRELLRRLDPDRLPEHAATHQVPVERAEALLPVRGGEHARHRVAALDQDRAAALLPEQELDQPLDVLAVERGVRRGRGQDARLVGERGPVPADERYPQVHGAPRGAHPRVVRAVPQHGGKEVGVENRAVARLDLETVRHAEPPRWRAAEPRPGATLADGFAECQDPSVSARLPP